MCLRSNGSFSCRVIVEGEPPRVKAPAQPLGGPSGHGRSCLAYASPRRPCPAQIGWIRGHVDPSALRVDSALAFS